MALGKILQILTNGSPQRVAGPTGSQPPSQAFHSALQWHFLEYQQETVKDCQALEESLKTKHRTSNLGRGEPGGKNFKLLL